MRATRYIIMGLLIMLLTACGSKEEKIVDELRDLTEQLENESDDNDDIMTYVEKYNTILETIENGEYNFSDEERCEILRLQKRFTEECIKHGAKNLGRTIRNVLQDGQDILNGFLNGLNGK